MSDAVAIERAVRAVPGVGGMHAGRYGTASTFTADGRIWGVRIAPDAIDVHVTSYPGVDLQALGVQVRAAVLAATPEQRISPVVWGSAGDKPEAIIARHRDTKLEMDGRAAFRWATTDIRDQLARICDAAGISLRDVDVFVPHQANTRIIDAMLRGQDFRDDVVVAATSSTPETPPRHRCRWRCVRWQIPARSARAIRCSPSGSARA